MNEDLVIKPGLSIRDDSIQEALLSITLTRRHFSMLRAVTKANLTSVYSIFEYVKKECRVPYEPKLLAEDVQVLVDLGVLQMIDATLTPPRRNKRRRK